MLSRHRRFLMLLAIMLAFPSLPLATATASPRQNTSSASLQTTAENYKPDSEECKFLTLINNYRASKGVGKLKLVRGLGAASEHHSVDMASKNYFSHTMMDGTTVDQNIKNHGNRSYAVGWGENIAAGHAPAAEAFEQWRNSEGHNRNMLDGDFIAIGIGRAYGENSRYGWYWTTIFGMVVDTEVTSCSNSTEPPPSPTPTPAPQPKQLKVARVSGTANSDSASSVTDGSTSTSWRSKPITPIRAGVTLDLGSVKEISTIKWFFTYGGNADSYRIRVSSDGVTWTTIARFKNGQADRWYSFDWGRKARYVRFSFSNPNWDQVIGYLGEVQIWQ